MARPPETITLPTRGWRIDKRKAIVVSALFWTGFALMVWLVTTGRTGGFDTPGLLLWRAGAGLVPKGPKFLLESVRDLTSLGGVLLRNLVAIGAVVALLFLRLRREAALLALTVVGAWIVEGGRPGP